MSTQLVNLSIPQTVRSIGDNAFKNCKNLKIVTLADSLETIGNYAFSGCSSLEKLEIPRKVETIGIEAFRNCSNIKTITWKDSLNCLRFVGDYAFAGNSSLTELKIPKEVNTIGMYAFSGCSKLERIELPSKLEKIDQFAFQNCKNLKTIISRIEKDSIFSIDDNVFRFVDNDNISNVSYELYQKATLFVPMPADSVDAYSNETIAEYMSKDGWKEFKNIISGEKGSKTVRGLTYEYLTGPKTATMTAATITDGILNIPGTVQIDTISYKVDSIGVSAFENYSDKKSLIKLTIGEGVKAIGANAFKGCTGLTSIKIPDSVTSIRNGAFQGCTGLTSIVIPSSVTNIEDSAFYKCSGLTSIVVELGNPVYDSRNNCNAIIETASNTLIA
jgi:hypothetical protein